MNEKKSLMIILNILLIFSLVLTACGGSATEAPAPEEQEPEEPAEEEPMEEPADEEPMEEPGAAVSGNMVFMGK